LDIFVTKSSANNKKQIIHELISILIQTGHIIPSYEEAIHKREQDFPTGLELEGFYNVAIPHAETEYVNKPAIVLGILEEPVLWENMEDPDTSIPVHIVFLLAIKNPELVVPNLKAMTDNIFSKPEVVAAIRKANDFGDLKLKLKELLKA